MKVLTKTELRSSRIDLPESVRESVIPLLNQTLANTLDLKTQVKQAHWNVKGRNFYALHLLFDEIAAELEEYADTLAERITALAGTAMGTARMVALNSMLAEYPSDIYDGMDHIRALALRLGVYGEHVREAIEQTEAWGDRGTCDLYTQISRSIDKRLWLLEAHCQAE